jgi:hypothetical protein
LSLFTHAGKQLSLRFGVSVNGTQLASTGCIEGQADMSLSKYRFLRWPLQNAARRHRGSGKEDVMAKVILFYVPAYFPLSNKQWTPEELRGKIINFPARTARKSA